MIILGVVASAAAGAVAGGLIFGGRQVHQNRKLMDAVYSTMAENRRYEEQACKPASAVVSDSTHSASTVEAEIVDESEDSSDDHCTYAVGDTVFVPDGVISQSGFAIRSGNYRIHKVDDEYIAIQKSKKTRTFRVRVEDVEKCG